MLWKKIKSLITNKVRLCEQSEPQSEPFVVQARQRHSVIENIFFEDLPDSDRNGGMLLAG